MIIAPATAADQPAIESLLDASFGPARRNRTAYRLREDADPIAALSFIARTTSGLAGSVQCWDIALAGRSGRRSGLVLLGPIAVAARYRGQGIASGLMRAALAAADTGGAAPVLLIGDEAFYGRFGFSVDATRGWHLPGPFDPARLLLRGGTALPSVGWVEPADGPMRRAA